MDLRYHLGTSHEVNTQNLDAAERIATHEALHKHGDTDHDHGEERPRQQVCYDPYCGCRPAPDMATRFLGIEDEIAQGYGGYW